MLKFNNLSLAEEERLWCLAEELGEVLQAIGKIGRHGYNKQHPNGGPNNRENLETELGHVLYLIRTMADKYDIEWIQIETAAEVKKETIKQYLHHQE